MPRDGALVLSDVGAPTLSIVRRERVERIEVEAEELIRLLGGHAYACQPPPSAIRRGRWGPNGRNRKWPLTASVLRERCLRRACISLQRGWIARCSKGHTIYCIGRL